MWIAGALGAFFLGLTLFQLFSGRAFTEVASWKGELPSTVTRQRQPLHYWFFVIFTGALAAFSFAAAATIDR